MDSIEKRLSGTPAVVCIFFFLQLSLFYGQPACALCLPREQPDVAQSHASPRTRGPREPLTQETTGEYTRIELISPATLLPDSSFGMPTGTAAHEISLTSELSGIRTERRNIASDGHSSLTKCPDDQESSENISDWPGLRRDTYHILAYQVVSVGILYVLPERITNWTDQQKHYSVGKWLKRVPQVHWDKDSWLFDYVQHPYWGAGEYIRARERGFSRTDAFLYSAAMSSIYEFIIEGQFEKPSIQDLVATPVIGSLAGSYFEKVRGRIRAKETRRWYDNVAMVLTDPFGSLDQLVDGLLGIRQEENVKCSLMFRRQSPATEGQGSTPEKIRSEHGQLPRAIGLELSFEW